MFVFDLFLALFRIAWWPSARNKLFACVCHLCSFIPDALLGVHFMYYGRFPLPIRSTRSSPIKRSGTGRARSAGVSAWSTLLGIAPASNPKILDMSKNLSRDREAKRSRSHREVIRYWLSRGRVDLDTFLFIYLFFFYDRVEI